MEISQVLPAPRMPTLPHDGHLLQVMNLHIVINQSP